MTPPPVLATSCVSTTSCSHSPARMELTGTTHRRFSFLSGDNYSIRLSVRQLVALQCYIRLRWHFLIVIHPLYFPPQSLPRHLSTKLLTSILIRFATSLNLLAALVTAMLLLLLVPLHSLPGINGNPVFTGVAFHVIKRLIYGSF